MEFRRVLFRSSLHLPENIRAWLGIAIQGFPDFEQFYSAGFPDGHSISLSPLCLPISPRPRDVYHSPIIKHGAKVYASSAKRSASTRPGPFLEIAFFFGRGFMMLIAEASSLVFKWAA